MQHGPRGRASPGRVRRLNGESVGELADVTYWGKCADDAYTRFASERRTPQYGGQGPYGWLDLPLRDAHEFTDRIRSWGPAPA